jgi:hypothetical protein
MRLKEDTAAGKSRWTRPAGDQAGILPASRTATVLPSVMALKPLRFRFL